MYSYLTYLHNILGGHVLVIIASPAAASKDALESSSRQIQEQIDDLQSVSKHKQLHMYMHCVKAGIHKFTAKLYITMIGAQCDVCK